jgi:2-methylcitrate dehydratase PrpD
METRRVLRADLGAGRRHPGLRSLRPKYNAGMSETGRAAEFVVQLKLADLPSTVRETARASILDTLACAVAGCEERAASAVRAWVVGEGAQPQAWIWATHLRSSAALASLANGTAAHALDYDDVNWALQGHPSAPLLPAVLAVSEAMGASGAEALLAYAAGFEVEARIGEALARPHYARGWHPTATAGLLGATAAAGRLLGLDEATLCTAFGIACSRAAGSRMNFGTDTKPLHAGLAARAGVECAQLAARGVSAHGAGLEADFGLGDLYGGARPFRLAEFGQPFALEEPGVELKPYPSCRFSHRTIDAVLALRERHAGAELLALECEIEPFALEILIHPRPRTGLEAKFSLPYCAAVAWLDGGAELSSFSDDRAARPDVQALLRRVDVRPADGAGDAVTAVFASGERDREHVPWARGSPRRPLERSARLHKVRSCLEPALGSGRTQELVAALQGLEQVPSAALLGALCAP